MALEVRLLRSHEHAELRRVRLSALAYSEHLAEHLRRQEAAPTEFWRERAGRAAQAAEMATFVAVEEGAFVGVVDGFLAEGGRLVEIGGMWVTPDRRRSGIGRALLDAVCDWGSNCGAERASLWVRKANSAARSLYEGEGFALAAASSGVAEVAGLRLEKRLQHNGKARALG